MKKLNRKDIHILKKLVKPHIEDLEKGEPGACDIDLQILYIG